MILDEKLEWRERRRMPEYVLKYVPDLRTFDLEFCVYVCVCMCECVACLCSVGHMYSVSCGYVPMCFLLLMVICLICLICLLDCMIVV